MSQRQVRVTREPANVSLTETVASTLKYENAEVPGSAGALAVEIEYAEVQVTPPTLPPGANAVAVHSAGLAGGKIAPAAVQIDEPGLFVKADTIMQTAGAGVPATLVVNPGKYSGPPVSVPKDTRDGKFYYTKVVEGIGDAAVMKGSMYVVFKIYR